MKHKNALNIIATIQSDFKTKFGIPRQSGLIPELKSKIIFTPEYRNPEALRGIEDFSHLWLLWEFSENETENWSATVRPPRLGGNKRMGVFATRSPFRPNPIGLSCVKLEKVIHGTPEGSVLEVSGADLLDGTPIYDIKPYIPYTDSHPNATGGFSTAVYGDLLEVYIPSELEKNISAEKIEPLKKILAGDPRPAYQNDSERIYSFEFADYKIKFKVQNGILTVTEVEDFKGKLRNCPRRNAVQN